MKKITLALAGLLTGMLVFSQNQATKPVFINKITVPIGQKIVAESSISMEASLSPGMDVVNKTTSQNTLEVKSSTDKNYTITSTLTKLKVDMEMMGQATNYDSEKKEDQESEVGKNFASTLNKPQDLVIDNATGRDMTEKKEETKKEPTESNPAQGLLSMFADNSSDGPVTSAFELIPFGKNIGDNWSDSSIDKDAKVVRTYTLKSVVDKEATIQLDVVMDATHTFELQGISMEFTSTTKTTGEIITDITTALVKKRTTLSTITGHIQLMGQEVPITAKANSTITYK